MKAVVAAFNQEKALVGAFSVITNLRMELFEALVAAGTSADNVNTSRWLLLLLAPATALYTRGPWRQVAPPALNYSSSHANQYQYSDIAGQPWILDIYYIYSATPLPTLPCLVLSLHSPTFLHLCLCSTSSPCL